MSSKRSRLEIYLEILQAIRKGVNKPTRIMYRTNLSWKPLMIALNTLMEQDLIVSEEEDNRTFFKITEKGRNVLDYFNKAMQLIEIK